MSDKYPGGFVTANAPAGFSVAFDGTGDYLTVPASSNFAPGTGNFTVDGWIYPTSSAIQRFFAQTTSGTNYFCCEADVPNKTIRFIGTSSGGGTPILSAATLQINQWNYFCISRTSGTVTVWCNGSAGTPTSNTTDFNNTTYVPTISGYTHSTSSEPIIGYLAGLRYIKGTALSGAVAPTLAFPVTNTQLLTCQSSTIIDLSTNALTVTVNGDAKVSNFTPFAAYTGFNPALGAAAGGVWTLDEAAYYQNNRQWPIYDPYFNNTTLMLHGNGTNGAQNNTFLDSSTNNFTITRNGNTTQGSFSPFSQTGWSNYFDGTAGQYLNTPSNSALAFGTGDFAVEAWVFVTGTSWCEVYTTAFGSTPTTSMRLLITNAQKLYFFDGTNSITSTATIPLYTWVHVAASRFGTLVKLFINGIQDGSTTSSNNLTNQVGYIGRTWDGFIFTGYISNLRVVKGAAVYTSNFTPSTAPLTAVTGTSLLTCQNNRYVDNSANNFALTVNGTPSVQAFSPFVPAYITPTTYSNWFDGTGDYLSSSSANYVCAGDFTVEAWFYATSNPSFGGIISTRSSTAPDGFNINLDSAQKIRFFINNNDFPSGFVSYNLNQWYHVALVRSGSTVTGYINGISVGTTTNSSTTSTTDLVIGRFYSDLDNYYLNGVVSNARFVNGTALYTANFTPPNAPFPTGTTNQQLLTCQASTLIDSNTYTTAKTITANGNVQPVTSPTPFPANVDTTTLNSAYSTSLIGGSGYFDGSGDYLTSPSNAAYQFDSGNFTVEAWIYFSTVANAQFLSVPVTGGFYWQYYAGALDFGCNGVGSLQASWSPKAYTWYHLAAVRSGSTLTQYVNGAVFATGSAFNITATGTLQIGYGGAGTFNGYMSGLRLVKGTAVYTSNFAPPITPPTAVTNTQLLLNYTNAGIYDSASKNDLETLDNAQVSTTQAKFGTTSISLDGTNDKLVFPITKNVEFNTGDFTIECWVYLNSVASTGTIASNWQAPSNYGWIVQLTSTAMTFAWGSGGGSNAAYSPSATFATGTWYHIAVTRSGTNLRLFQNGTQLGTTQTTSANITATVPFWIGANYDGNQQYLNGYIDDFRITKGVARYVTNFTPPTSQLQDQ